MQLYRGSSKASSATTPTPMHLEGEHSSVVYRMRSFSDKTRPLWAFLFRFSSPKGELLPWRRHEIESAEVVAIQPHGSCSTACRARRKARTQCTCNSTPLEGIDHFFSTKQ